MLGLAEICAASCDMAPSFGAATVVSAVAGLAARPANSSAIPAQAVFNRKPPRLIIIPFAGRRRKQSLARSDRRRSILTTYVCDGILAEVMYEV
jgi:hypothetical protein